MKLILCLILIALASSKATIPDLYNLNKGVFTNDYSVTYNGPVPSDCFGVPAEAGDINNDGISDFIITNPAFDNRKGMIYVIYGKPGSLRQFDSMDDFQPSDGFIIKGNVLGQMLGFSVSAAGDMNGDGIDDIVIGSAYWNQEIGMAYVLFGHDDFPGIVDVDQLSPTQGFKMFGVGANAHTGFSVSGAGDVNGDGLNDIIIGAYGVSRAYIVFGSKQGFEDMQLPPAAGKGFTVEGTGRDDFGNSVSKVGDFNGDGVDDVIIGAHVADGWAGRAYIIFGRKGGFPAVIQASEGMAIQGAQGGDNFGCAVNGAGDFNGDGLQDAIVGAYSANGGRGAAYVILGSRQNPSMLSVSNLASSRGFHLMSSSFSQLGLQVSGGRDLNGDGLSEVTVTAPAWNKEKGAAYVIYGYRPSSSLINIYLDDLKSSQGYMISGVKERDRFAHFARPIKDVNNDGVNDLIVGAFNANNGKGAAYLFYLPWKCQEGCLQCSTPNTCNDNLICPENCFHCSKPNTCDAWICPENCATCSKPNTCALCAQGFGFFNGVCTICSSTHVLNRGKCIEIQDSFKQLNDFFNWLCQYIKDLFNGLF